MVSVKREKFVNLDLKTDFVNRKMTQRVHVLLIVQVSFLN